MIRIYLYRHTSREERNSRITKAVTAFLAEEGNRKAFRWQIEKTQRGKPYFVGLPGRYLSLTDTGDLAAVGIADRELGIDLQQTLPGSRQDQRLIRLMERFFPERDLRYCLQDEIRDRIQGTDHKEAWDLLNRDEQDHVRRRFFELWTMKEAWCKYTGEGVDRGFLTRSILDIAEELCFKTCEPLPDVLLSVCTGRGADKDLKLVMDQ